MFSPKIEIDAQLLIRRPVSEVFNAFIDPAITTKFWFTHSSGKVEEGKELVWAWEMYQVEGDVKVIKVEQDKRIHIEWGNPVTQVEWLFTSRSDGSTLVQIRNWGFNGEAENVFNQMIDSKGGFTMVLAGVKAYLEHNIQLNLVADTVPPDDVKKEK